MSNPVGIFAAFVSLCSFCCGRKQPPGNNLIFQSVPPQSPFTSFAIVKYWRFPRVNLSPLLALYPCPEGPSATASVIPRHAAPALAPQSTSEYPTVRSGSSVCPRPPQIGTFPCPQPAPPLHSGHTPRVARTQTRILRLSLSSSLSSPAKPR